MLEFPLEHALAIVLGMCAGLSYAHEKHDLDGTPLHIVHRDIPRNVVVTFTGDVKIVDFGIAKSDNKLLEQTKSGKLKGKVPYMSPEQARGRSRRRAERLFSTGRHAVRADDGQAASSKARASTRRSSSSATASTRARATCAPTSPRTSSPSS
ncbi:MAG: protein kinase [Polyangiaceae bacterium]